MDRIIPDIEWCREISSQLGVSTRCPFSTVDECPRYYQSLSLLSSAGHTGIPPEKDALLLKKWKRHSLWPTIDEQATSVSGSPERRKTFSNFCPEVAYDRFGFFASGLYPYHDEIDHENGIKICKREGLPDGHWVFNWSYVGKIHYTDCPIYSPLKAMGSSQTSEKSLLDKILARFKNNPLIVALIIISIIIVGLGSFTDALFKIQSGIEKCFQKSAVTTDKATTNKTRTNDSGAKIENQISASSKIPSKEEFQQIPDSSVKVEKIDDKIRIRLNGKLIHEGETTGWVKLPILEGENQLEIEVFNQASKTGGVSFLGGAKREGWNYSVTIKSGDNTWAYKDGENVPPKSRWGTWFTVQNLKIKYNPGMDSISISNE